MMNWLGRAINTTKPLNHVGYSMHTQSITTRTVASLSPALIVQSLARLDDDGKIAIAARVCEIVRRPNAWTKPLALDLLKAIREEMAEQANLDAWIEQEAALDAARHSDPYALTKFGDAEFGA